VRFGAPGKCEARVDVFECDDVSFVALNAFFNTYQAQPYVQDKEL